MIFPGTFLPHTSQGKPQHSTFAARGIPMYQQGSSDLRLGTERSPGEFRGLGAIS
jgi:hypothetical protein